MARLRVSGHFNNNSYREKTQVFPNDLGKCTETKVRIIKISDHTCMQERDLNPSYWEESGIRPETQTEIYLFVLVPSW